MAIKPIRKKWKGTMTDRERFNAQMHYQEVDRCFNMEFGYWNENFKEWPLFYENSIKNNREADIFFNFDKIAVIGGKSWVFPPMPIRIIEEKETTRIVTDALGLITEVPKDGHDTIPHYIGATIKTPDDWKKAKEEHFNVNHPGRILDIESLKAQHPNDRDYPLGIDCGSMIGRVRDTLSFEGFCYSIYDYPEMIEDMVETSCQLVEHALKQLLPHFDFDYATGWEDICFKNGPIVSLPVFEKVVVPRYKRIGKMLKEYGIDLWYTDCDGDVRLLLPGFLESGINCLFPFEVNGCAHPAELLDEYGKELRIMGGIDKIQLGKGKEAIKAYLETVVRLVDRGGYIPFCDHRCPPNVDPDDYLYYLDLKEEMFGMK